MSSSAPKFRCYNDHMSGYSKRTSQIIFEFTSAIDLSRPETRTYECEVCGAQNEITKSKAEWTVAIN